MCGIVGIVNLNPRDTADEVDLKRMRDLLSHRGPDDEGLLIDGPVGLGHRRLSIVDLTGGHQPMSNEDDTVWIVYNGEVYNHASIRPRLESAGHVYRTKSDTETIIHLYEEEGERCVEHLRGMFAFAIWDRRRGRLLLARDRVGIKPLYYALTPTALLFASEIKSVLAHGAIHPALNTNVLPEFLAARYVSGRETMFQGIQTLLPGHTLRWSVSEGIKERRYWHLSMTSDGPTLAEDEYRKEILARLEESVRLRLMADVPLGVFLSGGMDSSAIAVLMSRIVEDPIRTFSVGFEEREANELYYARLVADRIGSEHHEVVVSPEEYFAALPKLIWTEDKPIAFTSSVPLYFVSRLAREHVKVVLTGEGSDELFLGYNRYRVTMWNDRLGRGYERMALAVLRRAVRAAVEVAPRPTHRYLSRTFLALPSGPESLYLDNFAVFSRPRQEALLAAPYRSLLEARDPYAVALSCFHEADGGILEKMSFADIHTYLVELLMKQDRMSMAASIESRVPFLDHKFVEFVAGMPSRFKLRGMTTKYILRSALKRLVPEQILSRKKMGFPVPIGKWLRGRFRGIVEEYVLGSRALARGHFDPRALRALAAEHGSGRVNHGDRLWLLINFEIWSRIFLDGEPVERVAGGLCQ